MFFARFAALQIYETCLIRDSYDEPEGNNCGFQQRNARNAFRSVPRSEQKHRETGEEGDVIKRLAILRNSTEKSNWSTKFFPGATSFAFLAFGK